MITNVCRFVRSHGCFCLFLSECCHLTSVAKLFARPQGVFKYKFMFPLFHVKKILFTKVVGKIFSKAQLKLKC